MIHRKSLRLLIDAIMEKAEMLDAFNEWKLISSSPMILELKFRITPNEYGQEISEKLGIGNFYIKFLKDSEQEKPIINHYGLRESNGLKENFIVGVQIKDKKFNTRKIRVWLGTMIESIILNYEEERPKES